MTNYFNNLNEKMADWFMLFFTDEEYAVRVSVVNPDQEYTTVDKETAAAVFADININPVFINDLKLKLTELAVIAGNALVSFINEITELTKRHRPVAVLLKVNDEVKVVKSKVTEVKESGAKKLTEVLTTSGKAITAGAVVADMFFRDLHGIVASRAAKAGHYFITSQMRSAILEGHST